MQPGREESAAERDAAARALEAICERVRAAQAARRALVLHGGATKAFYGGAAAGEPLDLRGYRGIVAYDPTELVVTARCGTPLALLHETLAASGQMLAFEPPSFGADATVGGMIACGLSGPRRLACGGARDFVLGAVLVDARAEPLRFGGQVMKNVAGYDVSRLLCGSLGVLGVVAEVSLKVLPVPAAERTLAIAIDEDASVDLCNRWGGRPLPVSATCWHDGVLRVRLSGAAAALEEAVREFVAAHGALELEAGEALAYWHAIREHESAFFADDTPLWRLSVPAVAPRIDFPGRRLIEWGGALRWLKTDVPADRIRAACANVGGHATLFRGGDRGDGVFQPTSDPLMVIQRRVKHQFDPHGIFNAGRLYPGI